MPRATGRSRRPSIRASLREVQSPFSTDKDKRNRNEMHHHGPTLFLLMATSPGVPREPQTERRHDDFALTLSRPFSKDWPGWSLQRVI